MPPCRMYTSASPRCKVTQLLECISRAPEVTGDGFEKRRAALQVLNSMLAGKDAAVPQDMLADVAACLLQSLAGLCTSESALPLDRPLSRYFYTILRTMQATVSQMESLQALPLATLVDCLRRFWVYGLAASRAKPEPLAAHAKSPANDTPPASPRITSYRPPHLRSQQRGSSSVGGAWRGRCDEGSASDCSDTESITASSDPYRASQVRIASLTCLQTMARADGKSLHPQWSAIFPVYTPLAGPASVTTLLDVIASDPQPRVRAAAAAAAAALMEGPQQRAYMAMAEHCEGHRLRGFTTLSAVLGKMAVCTHEGLLQALSFEGSPAALAALLRFADVLFGMTPYQRLPPALLPSILQDMQRAIAERLPAVATCAEELAAMQCGALSCLGPLFAASTALQPPAAAMSKVDIQGGKDSGIAGLPDLLAVLAAAPTAAVSAEALAALQPLALTQPHALRGCWHMLREAIGAHVQAKPLAGESADAAGAERAAVQGLRLLGCYLKACAERAGSAHPDMSLEMSSSALDQIRLSKRPALREAAASDALQDWSFTCGSVLPQAVAHERPAVRRAAMAALSSLSQSVYSCLSLIEQRQIWRCIQLCSADCASAVQAAALKAMGTLAMCPSSQTYPGVPALIRLVQEGLTCPVTSVQVAAAWALANAADTVARASACPGLITASIAEAAVAASEANEKVQANAIRALGHLLASGHSSGKITQSGQLPLRVSDSTSPSAADQGDTQRSAQQACELEGSAWPGHGEGRGPASWQQAVSPRGPRSECSHLQRLRPEAQAPDGSASAGEQSPAWVNPGLSCLIRALQSSSVKVQWNACYAAAALLRCQHAAGAAQRAGLLGQLLQQLLQTLKHSSNFKTRTHAAAAFANVQDAVLLESVGCDNLVQSLKEASAVIQDENISKACGDHEQGLRVDVTNIQSYQALKKQLDDTLRHIQDLRSSDMRGANPHTSTHDVNVGQQQHWRMPCTRPT